MMFKIKSLIIFIITTNLFCIQTNAKPLEDYFVTKVINLKCDKKKEKFTPIFKNVQLSNRYKLLDSIRSDLNNDRQEDFIGIIVYQPSNKLDECKTDEINTSYGLITSISDKTNYFTSYFDRVFKDLGFSEFDSIETIDNGFKVSFFMGQSKNNQLVSEFLIDNRNIKLHKINYYNPGNKGFETIVDKVYQDIEDYEINNVVIQKRLEEDF